MLRDQVEDALDRLADTEGFVERPGQRHLSLLLADLIEGDSTGLFEAPTGLGKSLAILIPAIAAARSGKRVVVATYTNVLAEQYWRSDLPVALSLFDDAVQVRRELLMGRARYACLEQLQTHGNAARPELGIESEFRAGYRSKMPFGAFWKAVQVPAACPRRFCPSFNECYYYRARRGAQRAGIVITNHSVVLQDRLLSRSGEEEGGLLGSFDFLVLDEAHDFVSAAQNAFEFELGAPSIDNQERLSSALAVALGAQWPARMALIERRFSAYQSALRRIAQELSNPGPPSAILASTPIELGEHPGIARLTQADVASRLKPVAGELSKLAGDFATEVSDWLEAGKEESPAVARAATEIAQPFLFAIRGFAENCRRLFGTQGVAVTHITDDPMAPPMVRQDVIDLAGPLKELLWDSGPWACVSATLALDGDFGHFRRLTGAPADYEEILPNPFDFETQASVYLPKADRIPDPTIARREGLEAPYFEAIARELTEIIVAMDGRTLALFHSRREMEEVYRRLRVPEELPVYLQPKSGPGSIGRKFIEDERSSLLALRSFWTGFDAPGSTLSCVVIVRMPFEIPVHPAQIARSAWLASQGLDAFSAYSLPQVKMLMRQGFGRLIRRSTDRGIVALLDPRLRTKRYGEEILANLPQGVRIFDDLGDAVYAIADGVT